MTPRTRFIVWVGLIALIIGAHGLWIGLVAYRGSADGTVLVGGSLSVTVFLLGMLWLLATTPPDAIKLKPAVSVALILGVAALVQAAAIICWRADPHAVASALRPPLGPIIMALAGLAAVALLFPLLRRQQRSPWCAALFAWSPLLLLEGGGLGHVGPVAALLVVACLAASLWLKAAPWPLAALAAGAAAAALGFTLAAGRHESPLGPLLCLLPLAALARPAWSAAAVLLAGVAPMLYLTGYDTSAWRAPAVYAACALLLIFAAWGAWRGAPAAGRQAD